MTGNNHSIDADQLDFAEYMAAQELASVVRIACKDSGLTRTEIADRLDIDKSTLSHLLNSQRNMTAGKAGRVLRALNRRLGFRVLPVHVAMTSSINSNGGFAPKTNVPLHFNSQVDL